MVDIPTTQAGVYFAPTNHIAREIGSWGILRVKVYRLNDDGKWDDQGTGHVSVDYLELLTPGGKRLLLLAFSLLWQPLRVSMCVSLVFWVNSTRNTCVHCLAIAAYPFHQRPIPTGVAIHRIVENINFTCFLIIAEYHYRSYKRSEELGLFVYDEEDNENILLHRISSDDIYRKQEDTIISWRDPEYATELALSFQEPSGCSYIWDNICNVQRNMHFNTLNSEPFHSVSSEPRELPAVELSTLPLILKTVVDSGFADQLRLTELILSDQAFFRKLMEVFRMCEDLENIDGLHMIFKIVKGIVLLNSSAIFERIFSDDFIVDIIGALEYDPEVPFVQHHRKFLKEHVVFKEAIPIKDPVVLSKIHQTYRVGFLKDVVLARVLDEGIGANLNSIIHSNNAYVYFLHEFCSLSKSLQMVQQLRLFRDLMNEGIFDVVTNVLQSQDKKLVLTGTDILILFLNQDPNLLRSYFVRQEGFALLGLLVKGMLTDFGENMHCQFLEILRNLLDSCTLSGPQRDTIIDIFFERHLGQLIEVITASCPSENTADASGKSIGPGRRIQCQIGTKPEILSNICELLCFCVLHHPYRIKCNFLLNNVIEKILLLIRRAERYLVVGAVRFIRTILSRHDEHLINYFVRNNVLKPIIDAFVSNGNRYNLLHSAVLELFEFIQKCLDNGGTKDATAVEDIRRRNDERALEREEERYFNEDSDEEDSASASVPRNQKGHQQPNLSNGVAASYSQLSPRSLVDYEDDEDDEDYKPPPREQPETSEEDDGIMESLRLKRKLPSKDKEPELEKKQKLSKNSKSKDSVFAALCSTLSQAVLPSKKTSIDIHTCARTDGRMSSSEDNQGDVQNISRSSSSNNSNIAAEDNHVEKEGEASRSFSDCLHAKSDNIQLGGEERPLVAPKSSPEMAVNGS
ncbi:hypothetical protein JHK82_046454 [Glycine max]|nr:hypothetical protein JHK82_046454 [Glycine max]